MKKLISIILVLCLGFSLFSFPSSAVLMEKSEIDVIENTQYNFSYTEEVKSDHTIVRTYSPSDNVSSEIQSCSLGNDPDTSKIRAVLLSLGLSEKVVNKMSEEDLREYADCEEITAQITYTKKDSDGNVVTVSEEEALQVASIGPNVDQDIFDDGGNSGLVALDFDSDEYMRITLFVYHLGGSRYKHTAQAEWIQMPFYRYTDCFTIAVQAHTTEYSTISGYYEYSTTLYEQPSDILPGTTYENPNPVTYNFVNEGFGGQNDYMAVTNGTWEGIGVKFNLPDDIVVTDANGVLRSHLMYHDFIVYLEFKTTVTQPDGTVNFNVSSRYDHKTIMPSYDFELGFSTTGAQLSCGMSFEVFYDPRYVFTQKPICYQPED